VAQRVIVQVTWPVRHYSPFLRLMLFVFICSFWYIICCYFRSHYSYIIMSFEYLECLCSSDRVRYMSKLTAQSVETCPYNIPTGSWIIDPQKCPGIEWSDVSYYLIETPGVFTRVHAKSTESRGSQPIWVWLGENRALLQTNWQPSLHSQGWCNTITEGKRHSASSVDCTKRTGFWQQHTVIVWLGK